MKPNRKPDRDADVTSPYGPQRQTDEAAGGADSSPYETFSSDERADAARAEPRWEKDDPATAAESGDRKVTGN